MKITNYQFPFEDTIIRVPMISYRRFLSRSPATPTARTRSSSTT